MEKQAGHNALGSVQRRLQVHIATIAALGTLLLGLAQKNPVLPLLVLFAAVTSVYFTDRLGWFRLHRSVANLAALGAVVIALSDFLASRSDGQLLAIANLLVYLQIILFYQEKNIRIYWQLCVLSLLQVVVAAALNAGLEFGLLLVLYLVLALFALGMLFVYRETLRLENQEARASEPQRRPQPVARADWQRLLGTRPVATPRLTRPLADRLLDAGFQRQIAGLATATLVFSVVFFYCMPRSASSVWQKGGDHDHAMVGFSPEITFDEFGRVTESNELVMRVAFYENTTGAPYSVYGEPYFRGVALTDYRTDGYRGKWQGTSQSVTQAGNWLPVAKTSQNLVRQEVVLEAPRDGVLFSVHPPYKIDATGDEVRYDPPTGQLVRARYDGTMRAGQYRYVVGTYAFQKGTQRNIFPHESRSMMRVRRGLRASERRALLHLPQQQFPQLIQVATDILQQESVARESRLVQARALEDHFRIGGQYTYTLDFTALQRTPGVDPIEDFVANHRTGHCEYYASALALMLRSQGIPARVVVGYKGGEYNSLGGYYQVRQRHAHAWVEAYLDPEDVTAEMLRQDESDQAGAWLRLDPTPYSDGPVEVNQWEWMGRMGDTLDYAQLLWNDYVLGLNLERQQQSIYEPLTDRLADGLHRLLDVNDWKAAWATLTAWLTIDMNELPGERWFRWRAGLAAMLLCSVMVGTYRLTWRIWRRLAGVIRHRMARSGRRAVRVAFYERLELLLARHRIRRPSGQTQREFARHVAGQLPGRPGQPEFSRLLEQIVEAFYQVRFGGQPLSPTQAEAVRQALDRLETLLNEANRPEQSEPKQLSNPAVISS